MIENIIEKVKTKVSESGIDFVPEFDFQQPSLAVLEGQDWKGRKCEIPVADISLMLCGATRSGKTYCIEKIMNQTILNKNSVHIIFDTKGDFVQKYYQPGDVVLALYDMDADYYQPKWNIFQEMSQETNGNEEVAAEIAGTIFKEQKRNVSNPYFPEAAEQVFAGLLNMAYQAHKVNYDNKDFFKNVNKMGQKGIEERFKKVLKYKHLAGLLDSDAPVTAAGVYGILTSVMNRVFVGNMAGRGDFSVQKFVRTEAGKKLFIEYDMRHRETAEPMVKLLLDLAMKESLANENPQKKIYFYIDECPLIPELSYFDNCVNFAGGKGVRCIAGVQSVAQLNDRYGRDRTQGLLSGFPTFMAFSPNDTQSADFVRQRAGKVYRDIKHMGLSRKEMSTERVLEDFVSDEMLRTMNVGDSIIFARGKMPFFFHVK